MNCELIIHDSVSCIVVGLRPQHFDYLYEMFGVFSTGYRFSPKFVLGAWDGKIRFFSKTGNTFVNLLPDIVPELVRLKYTIKLTDNRPIPLKVDVSSVDKDFFAHIKIPDSDDNWEFRPYQLDLINKLIDGQGGVGIAGTGAGKSLALDAMVLTKNGWEANGELLPGDTVVTPSGRISTIIDVFPQEPKQLYRVTFEDGASVECCDEHLWETNFPISTKTSTTEVRVTDTKSIRSFLDEKAADHMIVGSVSIPLVEPIQFPQICGFLHPYHVGIGLRDKERSHATLDRAYTRGTIEQRFGILRGLLDHDGKIDDDGKITFIVYDNHIFRHIQEIVWSLGGKCLMVAGVGTIHHPYPSKFFHRPEHPSVIDYQFSSLPIEMTRVVASIVPTKVSESQCISIDDPEQLYICDDYIVTHNTSMVAALVESFYISNKLRSIIIVPDKTLTMQTFVEYQYFGLDVGEYSGTTKDLDHIHIVSTWQALQHNPTIMRDFDVVVVDECHGAKGRVIQGLLNTHGKNIPFKFGVTGTLPKEPIDKMAIKVAIGDVLVEIPAHQLIAAGFLAKLDVQVMQMVLNLKPQYETYLEQKSTSLEPPLTYAVFKSSFFPDWPSEKHYVQHEVARIRWMADAISEIAKTGNTLILTVGVPFGKRLTKEIPGAVYLYGKDSVDERQEIYEMFKDNDDMIVLANAKIASTGLNIKRIFNMVIIDIGKSFTTTIQGIGRGLRTAKDKDSVKIYDLCIDTKYSKRHMLERIRYYNEAQYPNTKKKVDYY